MKNWKTTLLGAAIAGLVALQGMTSHDPKTIAAAFLIAAFGAVCKDFNVTGTGSGATTGK